MRLTRADGKVLLGAIAAELERQQWRQLRRSEYKPPLDWPIEQSLREEDRLRAAELRLVRDKIMAQL